MSKKESQKYQKFIFGKVFWLVKVVWKRRNKNALIDLNFTVKPVGFFMLDSESLINELISTEAEFQSFSEFNHRQLRTIIISNLDLT